MGCALAKSSQETEDDVVSLCRERKRLMKSAVNRRYALAEAHFRYNQSLCGVALAIRLFVARHSSPSSPFLITFPQPSSSSEPTTDTHVSNSLFYLNLPTLPDTHQANPGKLQDSPVKTQSCSKVERQNVDEEDEDDEERVMCDHFYDEVDPPPISIALPQNDFGWDFFNPFDGVIFNEFSQREGFGGGERNVVAVGNGGEKKIEVEEAKAVIDANVSKGEEDKGVMNVVDSSNPCGGRELLEALKDVEDHFLRVYDSNLDVCKLLETNVVQLQSGLEEIKESPDKIIPSITWQRSPLSRSSSCRSLLSSTSFSSSTWTGFNSTDLFDEYGGMESGNHSLTLGRLYAWEKKLYDEVKTGSEMRKLYDRKSSQLSKDDENGDGCRYLGKTGDEVRDLYSRILVSIKAADSISKRIEKLRDEELQPQLVELLQGLTRSWKMMAETHRTQSRTMFEVKSFTNSAFGNFSNDSHRLATLQLEVAIQEWRACFSNYIFAQKEYIEALHGWISMLISSETDFYSINRPELSMICQEWLLSLKKLPDERVKYTLKDFAKDIRSLWAQQGIERQQKRKLDRLSSELEKKAISFQKTERKVLETKPSDKKSEVNVRNRVDYLAERKGLLEMHRKRLETEKARHENILQEMQRVNLVGFQVGFSSVFDSLTEFSEACAKMYADLVENGKTQLKSKALVRSSGPNFLRHCLSPDAAVPEESRRDYDQNLNIYALLVSKKTVNFAEKMVSAAESEILF